MNETLHVKGFNRKLKKKHFLKIRNIKPFRRNSTFYKKRNHTCYGVVREPYILKQQSMKFLQLKKTER